MILFVFINMLFSARESKPRRFLTKNLRAIDNSEKYENEPSAVKLSKSKSAVRETISINIPETSNLTEPLRDKCKVKSNESSVLLPETNPWSQKGRILKIIKANSPQGERKGCDDPNSECFNQFEDDEKYPALGASPKTSTTTNGQRTYENIESKTSLIREHSNDLYERQNEGLAENIRKKEKRIQKRTPNPEYSEETFTPNQHLACDVNVDLESKDDQIGLSPLNNDSEYQVPPPFSPPINFTEPQVEQFEPVHPNFTNPQASGILLDNISERQALMYLNGLPHLPLGPSFEKVSSTDFNYYVKCVPWVFTGGHEFLPPKIFPSLYPEESQCIPKSIPFITLKELICSFLTEHLARYAGLHAYVIYFNPDDSDFVYLSYAGTNEILKTLNGYFFTQSCSFLDDFNLEKAKLFAKYGRVPACLNGLPGIVRTVDLVPVNSQRSENSAGHTNIRFPEAQHSYLFGYEAEYYKQEPVEYQVSHPESYLGECNYEMPINQYLSTDVQITEADLPINLGNDFDDCFDLNFDLKIPNELSYCEEKLKVLKKTFHRLLLAISKNKPTNKNMFVKDMAVLSIHIATTVLGTEERVLRFVDMLIDKAKNFSKLIPNSLNHDEMINHRPVVTSASMDLGYHIFVTENCYTYYELCQVVSFYATTMSNPNLE